MSVLEFFSIQNLDLISVGIMAASTAVLGFTVFRNNPKSITNQTFLIFSLIGIFYALFNFASSRVSSITFSIWLLRATIFFALWHSFFIFRLFYVFPKASQKFSKFYTYGLTPLTILTSVIIFAPLVFVRVAEFYPGGGPSRVINGPGIAIFGALVTAFVFGGIFLLFKKMKNSSGIERVQFKYVFIGSILTFSLLIVFNFIFPALLDDASFIPFAPVFTFPFLIFTAYAIVKHQLFNIRLIATELFTTLILIVLFADILFSKSITEFAAKTSIFLITFAFSILLVRGTIREIRELQRLSQAKSDFVSLVSHQLRTPLSAIKGFVSMIIERSGTEEDRNDWLKKTFLTNERLIRLVSDILDVSRIEEGRIVYNFKPTDIPDLIDSVVSEASIAAKDKGLALLWQKPETAIPNVYADEIKLRQVILNLIDNAIKYTNKGWVSVRLLHYSDLGKIQIIIQDTGIGMSKEDLDNLFGRFARGKSGKKSNTEGMGIGLYVARHIVAAHRGRIWAESEGPGTGSKFYVELPVQ